jgi:tetratricopeptide (TPR) repeat protein
VSEARRVATVILAAALVFGGPARAEDEPKAAGSAPPAAGGSPEATAPSDAAPDSGASAAATRSAPLTPAEARKVLDEVWQSSEPLPERARQARVASLQLGIWSLDPAARALLHDASLGSALERAEAAALLAPELPDAELAAARERVATGDVGGAFGAVGAAFAGLSRHPEASLWLRASLADAAAHAAIFGGLLFLVVAGLGSAAALVTPLALRIGAPTASGAALLGALLLLPAAAGQGALGVALACAALALARSDLATRAAVLVAALLVLAGLHGVAQRRDAALAAVAHDPVGMAALSAERDFATPLDLARLERAAADDALARQAYALHLRRVGDVAESDRRFRELLEAGESSPEALNNAANSRFAAGAADEALALYERAARAHPSPLMLFNLAQAYGRAILLEEQDLALAQAQALDPRAVHALTQHVAEVGGGGPVDVAVSAATLLARAPEPESGATSLARRFAPGWLGASWLGGLAGLAVAVLAGAAAAVPARRLGAGDDLYSGIVQILQGREATDPSLRRKRLGALRSREARLARLRLGAAWVVPGAAALQAGKAPLGLFAALLAATVWAALRARGGLLPDPFTSGHTAALLFGGIAALATLALLGSQALSLALLRRRR